MFTKKKNNYWERKKSHWIWFGERSVINKRLHHTSDDEPGTWFTSITSDRNLFTKISARGEYTKYRCVFLFTETEGTLLVSRLAQQQCATASCNKSSNDLFIRIVRYKLSGIMEYLGPYCSRCAQNSHFAEESARQ